MSDCMARDPYGLSSQTIVKYCTVLAVFGSSLLDAPKDRLSRNAEVKGEGT